MLSAMAAYSATVPHDRAAVPDITAAKPQNRIKVGNEDIHQTVSIDCFPVPLHQHHFDTVIGHCFIKGPDFHVLFYCVSVGNFAQLRITVLDVDIVLIKSLVAFAP